MELEGYEPRSSRKYCYFSRGRSDNGLRAAKAAGLACVIVANDYTREQDFGDADLVLDGSGPVSALPPSWRTLTASSRPGVSTSTPCAAS